MPSVFRRILIIIASSLLAAACAGPSNVGLSSGHLLDEEAAGPGAASPEQADPVAEPVPAPVPAPPREPVRTYTVVVKDVPVNDLLFSLARDAGLDLDLQADSRKTVTINAVERPINEILARLADQASLRYQLRGSNLLVEDDAPYWKNYLVDYVNIARNAESEVGVATQIATTGGTVGEELSGASQGDQNGNLSKTTVKNLSNNDFWMSLETGLEAIIKSTRDAAGEAAPEDNDPVIINRMSGVVTVFGSQRQQIRIKQYLDSVMANSQRQVLIEMTIVEVELSDNYQAGVDWQRLSDNAGLGNNGVTVRSNMLGANLAVPPFVSLGYNSDDPDGSNIAATVKMLQQFGDTKVLSSPKVMALNNQTALLKVVNENVYFTVELDIRDATADIPERRTFTSEIHTVPVGLVLSVTPQISDRGLVNLNVRPTISRITGFAVDPAPRLAGADFDNLIPEIQVREIESLLQVGNGRTVVLGGLMQNERASDKDGIPGLSRIPKVGKLFSYTSDKLVKTELVIFLKPTIISNGRAPASAAQLTDFYDVAAESTTLGSIEYR
ncbi:MAG: pilus (MSHA type) biogenesis protein MshL [Woeseiaceae bacterium]|nr:pilus (MSHA type) biogenesis protein MshL [Woeseiaceae bacterium]